jgi:hypothetical protein
VPLSYSHRLALPDVHAVSVTAIAVRVAKLRVLNPLGTFRSIERALVSYSLSYPQQLDVGSEENRS